MYVYVCMYVLAHLRPVALDLHPRRLRGRHRLGLQRSHACLQLSHPTDSGTPRAALLVGPSLSRLGTASSLIALIRKHAAHFLSPPN